MLPSSSRRYLAWAVAVQWAGITTVLEEETDLYVVYRYARSDGGRFIGADGQETALRTPVPLAEARLIARKAAFDIGIGMMYRLEAEGPQYWENEELEAVNKIREKVGKDEEDERWG